MDAPTAAAFRMRLGDVLGDRASPCQVTYGRPEGPGGIILLGWKLHFCRSAPDACVESARCGVLP